MFKLFQDAPQKAGTWFGKAVDWNIQAHELWQQQKDKNSEFLTGQLVSALKYAWLAQELDRRDEIARRLLDIGKTPFPDRTTHTDDQIDIYDAMGLSLAAVVLNEPLPLSPEELWEIYEDALDAGEFAYDNIDEQDRYRGRVQFLTGLAADDREQVATGIQTVLTHQDTEVQDSKPDKDTDIFSFDATFMVVAARDLGYDLHIESDYIPDAVYDL